MKLDLAALQLVRPCWPLSDAHSNAQAVNGVFAALIFNLLYDAVLSRSVEWHTMCPWIDLMNHRTGIKARPTTHCLWLFTMSEPDRWLGAQSQVEYEFFSDQMAAYCDNSFTQARC